MRFSIVIFAIFLAFGFILFVRNVQATQTVRANGKIAFTSDRNGNHEIYTMNSDGTGQTRLTFNNVKDDCARWSPNGKAIAFIRNVHDGISLFLMNQDGTQQRRIDDALIVDDSCPSWSPDGEKLAFAALRDIWTIDLITRSKVNLTNSLSFEIEPSWSPDGSKISYGGSPGIWVMKSDGTGQVRVGGGLFSYTSTESSHWLISSNRILFSDASEKMGDNNRILSVTPDGLTLDTIFSLANVPIGNVWRLGSPRMSPDGSKFLLQVDSCFTPPALCSDLGIMNSDGSNVQVLEPSLQDDTKPDWQAVPLNPLSFDYDGDRKSDISVWRPSNGTWYVGRSATSDMYVQPWGMAGDQIVPADYDGDGKTDIAVRRPSDNNFYIFNSSNSSLVVRAFGIAGDIPVPSDFSGDGKADVAVWRPSEGTWYISRSAPGDMYVMQWGLAADKPVPGDFDGDGMTNLAVFRPTDGKWYTFSPATGTISVTEWGVNGDQPLQGDYNGDGRNDFAVYRPLNNTWFVQNSNNGAVTSTQWGLPNDFPTPGDFDGDGKTDVAVWRPSNGTWYVLKSTSGVFTQSFGTSGDTPTPNAFVY